MTSIPMTGVSVIVPAYNYARYLGQALDSILGQSRPPAEVIVVDDGSTDHTAAVAANYGDRIRYLHQANRGPGAARNVGVEHAHGQFLAFLDGDDWWEPAKLEWQLAVFEADPAMDIVFTYVQQYLSPELARDPRAGQYLVPDQPNIGYSINSMLARRPVFERVGPFSEGLVLGEVIDWLARAEECDLKMQILPEVFVWRRIHGQNLTLRSRPHRPEYARIIKAALDRRRAARPGSDQTP
jgi:glycosyltransferase involved in cell wall biosynthesis